MSDTAFKESYGIYYVGAVGMTEMQLMQHIGGSLVLNQSSQTFLSSSSKT